MTEKERYDNIDMPFYRDVVSPLLPESILDFHAHVWKGDQWVDRTFPSARYMSTELDYGIDRLLEDGGRMFPQKKYHAVVFGQPTPSADLEKTNRYVVENAGRNGLYPLLITGKDLYPKEELRRRIFGDGLFGYKVFLNWVGNDYGNICIEDMIGPDEMGLAEEAGLVVLLHVPRAGRLADPAVSRGVRELALRYPGANIVLAHCGRCYRPPEMRAAVGSITDLENVYLDTSMVMDPTVLHILFNSLDHHRVLFATDFPVAAMRGRRVNVMDHWVDVVLEGYPESEYRVASDNIRASFMAYEIVLAIAMAADTAGLKKECLADVYCNNGISLLRRVRSGKL